MTPTRAQSNPVPKEDGFVSGCRFSCAMKRLSFPFLLGAGALALLAILSAAPPPAHAQPPSAAPASAEPPAAPAAAPKKEDKQAAPERKSFGRELAEQTREATGEEENANLKYSGMVRLLGRTLGLNVHQAHLLALGVNFAIVFIFLVWAGRKFLPIVFRDRSAAIEQALAEARAASQDANRRLSDIENRLRQLDVEIGKMQATAEKEADAEEARIRKAAEDDIRKVVRSAEQEIATAAKQARHELTIHTAGLAIGLARKQIHVDANTDEVLVHTFASKLALDNSSHSNDGGKDGR
jgi:F-type H+-transporting ATPase subunit b